MNSGERKLSICHVITRMIVGGAQENTLWSVVDHIAKGHNVVLLTGPSPGPEGKLLQNVKMPNFEIIEVPSLVREINPIQDTKAYFELKKIFKTRKFDVVHTHSSKAGLIGRVAAWHAKVPLVVHTVHGQAFHPYEKKWKNFIYKLSERYAAKHCHRIYAVAQAMIDSCVDNKIAPREKYQVVYSGMDINAFLSAQRDAELNNRLNIPPEAKVIGAVARLFPLKGYEFFIPAAIEIAKKFDQVHFLIVGDGIMMDDIIRQVSAQNLLERFHFTGLVPPHEVAKYIAQMDLLWHLSLREGLPRSVVQALAGGKAAIGYKLDGTPEVVIDGQTGYCVTPESIDEVIEKTTFLLNNPALLQQMGINGQNMVREKFDHFHMTEVLEQEYLRQLTDK